MAEEAGVAFFIVQEEPMTTLALVLAALLSVSEAWASIGPLSTTLQSAAVATGNGTALAISGYASVGLQVTIATTATVTFEGSVDKATTYNSVLCTKVGATTTATTATATGAYQCNVAGMTHFRARISAWTSGAVTVKANFIEPGGSSGGGGGGGSAATQYTEDDPETAAASLMMAGAVRRDTAASSAGTDGDNATINVDSLGRLHVTGTQIEDAAHSSGDKGNMSLCVRRDTPTSLAGADNDYIPCTTDSLGGQWVAIDHMVQIIGAVAHDAVDAQPPVKVGAKAIAHGTNPTAVAAADVTDTYANRAGIPFVIGGHPNIVTLELAFTAAQTDTAVVTVSAGTKIVVTSAQATCANSNTVDVAFRLGFGTANTPTTTGVVLTHPGIAAGSGISRGDGSGIIGVGADDADLRVTAGVPTTGSCRVLVSYHTIES